MSVTAVSLHMLLHYLQKVTSVIDIIIWILIRCEKYINILGKWVLTRIFNEKIIPNAIWHDKYKHQYQRLNKKNSENAAIYFVFLITFSSSRLLNTIFDISLISTWNFIVNKHTWVDIPIFWRKIISFCSLLKSLLFK